MTGVSDELRAWLRPLADELIPAGDGMPSASAAGVADEQLDLVLAARPDLLPHLLRAHGGADDAETMAAVAEIVAGGYYANPTVRDLLGYTGQRPIPVRPPDFPEYVTEGLLERVVARGPICRPVER